MPALIATRGAPDGRCETPSASAGSEGKRSTRDAPGVSFASAFRVARTRFWLAPCPTSAQSQTRAFHYHHGTKSSACVSGRSDETPRTTARDSACGRISAPSLLFPEYGNTSESRRILKSQIRKLRPEKEEGRAFPPFSLLLLATCAFEKCGHELWHTAPLRAKRGALNAHSLKANRVTGPSRRANHAHTFPVTRRHRARARPRRRARNAFVSFSVPC